MEINQWWEIRKMIVELDKKIQEYNEGKTFCEKEENELSHLLMQAWTLVNEKC